MLNCIYTTAKVFIGGIVIRIFQYGYYVLIPTEHIGLYCPASQMGLVTPDSKGFLGAWYRIGVDLEI